jgi:hypothetical protein
MLTYEPGGLAGVGSIAQLLPSQRSASAAPAPDVTPVA